MTLLDENEKEVCRLTIELYHLNKAIVDTESSNENVIAAEQREPEVRERLDSILDTPKSAFESLERKLRAS